MTVTTRLRYQAAFRAALAEEARALKSEHGENREYDRALVELVTFMTGRSAEQFPAVARELGITTYGTAYDGRRVGGSG